MARSTPSAAIPARSGASTSRGWRCSPRPSRTRRTSRSPSWSGSGSSRRGGRRKTIFCTNLPAPAGPSRGTARSGQRRAPPAGGALPPRPGPGGGGGPYPRGGVRGWGPGGAAPACPACAEPLKPDVVFFGELLPPEAIARATEVARRAGLLLVVGSSLEVYPVAGLPEETLAAGGELAIVNRGPTSYDPGATVHIEGSAGEVLPAVVELLRGEDAQQP